MPKRLLFIGGGIALLLVIGWFLSRGETNADDLQVGDCFVQPTGSDDIRSVDDQSCDGLHESEVYSVLEDPDLAWPGLGLNVDTAIDTCLASVDFEQFNQANIPDDAELAVLFSSLEEWNSGDGILICYLTSVSGLTGPAFNS